MTFRDAIGHEWMPRVTVATVARVLDSTGVDLTQVLQGRRANDAGELTADDHLANVSTFFRVLCCVLRRDLDAQGLDDEAFGDRLQEEHIEAALIALYEAAIAFFRGPKREALRIAFRKNLDAARRKREEAESAAFAPAAATADGKLNAGVSPASSGSTPNLAPSAN